MLIPLLKGCHTEEEKEKRKQVIRSSREFIVLLISILKDRYETIERKGRKEEDYQSEGWVFLQAFRNGKIAELEEIVELLLSAIDKDKK
jgi:hypothetical protein